MIVEPERYVEAFAQAGANILTVHVETCPHLHRTIQQIKELGVKAGVALNPATSPTGAVEEILPEVDLVVVMSVNPGFGGQKYIPASTNKIRRLRQMLHVTRSAALLEVDGGVKVETTRPKSAVREPIFWWRAVPSSTAILRRILSRSVCQPITSNE